MCVQSWSQFLNNQGYPNTEIDNDEERKCVCVCVCVRTCVLYVCVHSCKLLHVQCKGQTNIFIVSCNIHSHTNSIKKSAMLSKDKVSQSK